MKKMTAVAVVVALLGYFSRADAETTFRLGGGLNNNSARVSDGTALGVSGALDFSLGDGPWMLGVFGEGNFDEAAGKPLLAGLNVFYKMSVGSTHSDGLDPKIYIGPSIGVASIDVGERKSTWLLGGTLGAEFPLSKRFGLFGNGKYSWTNDKDGIELMKGFSAHAGVMFHLGN